MLKDVHVATLWQRPSYSAVDVKLDFVLQITEDWLVFPYEISVLSLEETTEHKPFLVPYLKPKLMTESH